MKTFIAFACVLLAAGGAKAQNQPMARQPAQAQGASAGAAVPTQAGVPPPNALPPNPVLQATLNNIRNLRSDFATLARMTNTVSIDAERPALTNDLSMAALGKRPAPETVLKLADDLGAVIAGNAALLPEHPKLAQFVHAAFNGSQLTPPQEEMIFSDTQTILADAGAAPSLVTNVVNDLKTIAGETK